MPHGVYESVAGMIGNTPLVRINNLHKEGSAELWAKVEFANPGGSVKDRIAVAMIDAAEKSGELLPGATIVDSTSGNTGAGLALIAATRGYRSVFVCSDKVSHEKVALLEALGSEVVRTSSKVAPDHPESAHSVAERLVDEIPGAWSSQQYENANNPAAHYNTTGPEIWEQTEGRITHFVANVGTGGTICGTGRYLKEVSGGRVIVVGADPVGSAYSGPVAPYLVEGAGRTYADEALWPETYDRTLVDRFIQIDDDTSFRAARASARKEGLLIGPSAGTVVAASVDLAAEVGPGGVVVALLADTGRNYLSKVFDDDWLRSHDLTETTLEVAT